MLIWNCVGDMTGINVQPFMLHGELHLFYIVLWIIYPFCQGIVDTYYINVIFLFEEKYYVYLQEYGYIYFLGVIIAFFHKEK